MLWGREQRRSKILVACKYTEGVQSLVFCQLLGRLIGKVLGSNPSSVTTSSLRLTEPFHSLALVRGLWTLKKFSFPPDFWLRQGGGEGNRVLFPHGDGLFVRTCDSCSCSMPLISFVAQGAQPSCRVESAGFVSMLVSD